MLTNAERKLGWALTPDEYRNILNERPAAPPAPSPEPEGTVIVDLKVTVGEKEFFGCLEEQKVNKKLDDRLCYEYLDRDLTRSHKKPDGTRMPQQSVYLWLCVDKRNCRDLICSLKVVPVDNGSRSRGENKSQDNSTRSESTDVSDEVNEDNVRIIRHPRLPFELHCMRGGTTPIVSLEVAGRKESRMKNSNRDPKKLIKRTVLRYALIHYILVHYTTL